MYLLVGAVHNVVFAGFSAEALGKRLQQSEAKVVFTADRVSQLYTYCCLSYSLCCNLTYIESVDI